MISRNALLLSCLLLSNACSTNEMAGGFAGGTKATKKRVIPEKVVTKSSENAVPEGINLGTTESFTTKGSSGRVDIAWYVDQSGSMSGETKNVQKNFASFMASVNAIADARVALVAASTDSNAISITPVENKQIQVEVKVASNDALTIAINSFVQPGFALPDGVTSHSKALGKLANFFRADVPAVMVVVTDDDARGVTSANFEDLAKKTLGKVPKLFAFRATEDSKFKNEPGCQIARQGVSYETLATSTGGEVFDICEPDWAGNFEKLKQGIAEAAQNSFSLKKVPAKINEVKVNGAVLNESGYTVSRNLITIAPESIPPTGEVVIEVSYL